MKSGMKQNFKTIKEIKELVDDSQLVYLLGDFDAEVQITGDVQKSNVVPGTYSVETEIGTVYLNEGEEYGFLY